MSKRHICKSKFHVCYNFLRFLWKNFPLSCRKHPKTIEITNDIFSHFLWFLSRFHLFEAPKRSKRIKKHVIFPPYSIEKTRVKTAFCWTLSRLMPFYILNNRDTKKQILTPSELLTNSTTMQSFYQMKLTFSVSYCQILKTCSKENCTRLYFFLSQM